VLVTSYEKGERDRFAACLDGIFRLVPAGSEQQLWAALDQHVIDVIIISPGTDNFGKAIQLCCRLKSAPQTAHLPVILLIPGHSEARIGGLRAGADACVELPFSRDHLCAQVRNLLSIRLRLKQYFSQPLYSGFGASARTAEARAFIGKLHEYISANLHNAELSVDALAQTMNTSRPTLHRKTRNITKKTPIALVNFIRLNKAAELLMTGEYKVFQIAERVGFPSRSNFGRSFVRQFGLTPLQYVRRAKKSAILGNPLH